MMPGLACVVLAAGEGKRFNSKFPKPLQRLCGRPIIEHVLAPLEALEPEKIVIVVGIGREQVTAALEGRGVEFAVQAQQLGTGHATLCAEECLEGFEGTVLVTCADIPLVSKDTLQRLVSLHRARRAAATVLTANMPDPSGYGRIVRSRDGRVRAIVEHNDATDEIRQIQEINAGIYCFEASRLFSELRELGIQNVQHEHYLTDIIGRLVLLGEVVTAVGTDTPEEVIGINERAQLARAEATARDLARKQLFDSGVTLTDPGTVYADVTVQVGRDTVVHPGVHLLGETLVGEDCEIGPYAQIRNSKLGDRVRVMQGAVVTDSVIGDDVFLGPYSHVRSGSEIGDGGLVGNYAEIARTRFGPGARTCHFSFLGDAELGADVNIGAGTITCNYDGMDKHPTTIEEGAFVGSDAVLVAPVTVGKGAYVAAGSVITQNVPAGTLAIARERQTIKADWKRRVRE